MLIIKNLTKKYRNKMILNDINLDIKGVFGLLGQNGAGKTTLLNIIATATKFNTGEITYKGVNWNSVNEVREMIGYLPQKFSMYDKLTVYECLEYLSVLKGLKLSKRKLEEVLLSVNLQKEKDKKINEISGGMLRRLGIGQALLGNPKIIIVDEPTTGLDLKERIRFRNLLRVIGESKIVLISSHIVEDLDAICNQFAILKEGTVIIQGTKEKIINFTKPSVWEMYIKKSQLNLYINDYHVISFIDIDDRSYRVRFLSSRPPKGAIQVTPTLEDSYLSIG